MIKDAFTSANRFVYLITYVTIPTVA